MHKIKEKRRYFMKKFGILCLAVIVCVFVMRPKVQTSTTGKKRRVEYAICKKENQPTELRKLILKEKNEAFHFVFTTGDMMYVVTGYGRQERGNYKVKLDSFQEDAGHIYIKTSLVDGERRNNRFPYIVVKCVAREKEVVFL